MNKATEARAAQLHRGMERRRDICEKVKAVLEENNCTYSEMFNILSDVSAEYRALANEMLVRELKPGDDK